MDQKTALTWTRVVAVLYFIGAAAGIIGGLAMATLGAAMLGSFGALIGGAAGVAFVVGGLISLLIGIFVWKRKNWARIVVIVFAVLGVLSSLGMLAYAPMYGIVYLVIEGAILWLFAFQKDVKAAFS